MAEGIKFAWGNKPSSDEEKVQEPITSLMEIMEEQSQKEEQQQSRTDFTNEFEHLEADCSRDFELALELSRDPDCTADEHLALKLQREFDREDELTRKFGESKATTGRRQAVLAPDPYNYVREMEKYQQTKCESSDDEEEGDDDELREFATSLLYEKLAPSEFSSCGILKNTDGTVVTKHDPVIAELKSTDKALQLPLALSTGDFIDSRIGGKVLNELRTFGKTESRRKMRAKDKEEKATSEMSVDMKTRLTLLKWINSGEFDRVGEVIATGKEAAVLHAILDADCDQNKMGTSAVPDHEEVEEVGSSTVEAAENDGRPVRQSTPTHFAIKVYKTTLTGFRNRAEYVKDDFRFRNPRRVMKIWTEKEFLNLKRLKNANIKCPTPIKLRKHVLLMSMIGDAQPALKLKELKWTDDSTKLDAFEQVREIVIKMYKQCQLVHGDLSEFNLLYHLGIVYVIDLAQAMDISHTSSLRFLHRDIVNVLDFFGRIGCEPLPTPHALFQEVTDIEFDPDKNLYVQVESFERDNRSMDLRDAKASPANYELHLHRMESTGRADSPSRPYN
uniref:Serine/threonine-protein kinase RIO3 n=1 Tax=Globodera pallida TaxID=36090 RepID=A0A183BHY2_GLOPA